MNTSLFSWFYYEILENKLSTFFILHHIVVQNPLIKDCACVPVSDALTGQAPKLYIALSEAGESAYDQKEFKSFLASHLDANKQPKYIEIIKKIPRTFNGKIRRNLLTDRDKDQ